MASQHSVVLFLTVLLLVTSCCLATRMKKMKFVFYMQDIGTGPNATAIVAAKPNTTSLSGFGSILVIDDVLTEEADPSSKILGRAKGLYEVADIRGASIHMIFSVVFEEKHYNGSTIEILGTDNFFAGKPAEVAVVGGTRRFRYARGYAIVETVAAETGKATMKFNVTLQRR